jgi:hypothetical protein
MFPSFPLLNSTSFSELTCFARSTFKRLYNLLITLGIGVRIDALQLLKRIETPVYTTPTVPHSVMHLPIITDRRFLSILTLMRSLIMILFNDIPSELLSHPR